MAIYKRINPNPTSTYWQFTSEYTAILRIGNVDYWVKQIEPRKCQYGDGNRIGDYHLGEVKLATRSRDCPLNAAFRNVYKIHMDRIIDDLVAISILAGETGKISFETKIINPRAAAKPKKSKAPKNPPKS